MWAVRCMPSCLAYMGVRGKHGCAHPLCLARWHFMVPTLACPGVHQNSLLCPLTFVPGELSYESDAAERLRSELRAMQARGERNVLCHVQAAWVP